MIVNVNPNCGYQYNKPKSTNVVKGTATAGLIGAGVYGIGNLAQQTYLLKNKDIVISMGQDLQFLKKTMDPFLKEIPAPMKKILISANKSSRDTVASLLRGKYNLKAAGIASLSGAAAFGLIYLAYRGIKALCSKPEPKKVYLK